MNAKEFVIKNFETNYPYLLKIISEYEKFSIEENFGYLHIVIGIFNIENYPPNKFNKNTGRNECHFYFLELQKIISNYLFAIGYIRVECVEGEYCHIGYHNNTKGYYSGYLIKAYYK